jgi:K+ transporter
VQAVLVLSFIFEESSKMEAAYGLAIVLRDVNDNYFVGLLHDLKTLQWAIFILVVTVAMLYNY